MCRNSRYRSLPIFLLRALIFPIKFQAGQPLFEYGRQHRPPFADTSCRFHVFDKYARKTDQCLDTEGGSFAERGRSVIPGNMRDSMLCDRRVSEDEYGRMPPFECGKPLSEGKVRLIRRWIEEGKIWAQHGSLFPTAFPPLPEASDRNGHSTEIDHDVISRPNQSGLTPPSVAGMPPLFRRVNFGLTEILPMRNEIAYELDQEPNSSALSLRSSSSKGDEDQVTPEGDSVLAKGS